MLPVPSGPVEKILPRGAEIFDTALTETRYFFNKIKTFSQQLCFFQKIIRIFKNSHVLSGVGKDQKVFVLLLFWRALSSVCGQCFKNNQQFSEFFIFTIFLIFHILIYVDLL
jgi:hypothetical protein